MQIKTNSTAPKKMKSWSLVITLFKMIGVAFNPLKNKKPKTVKLLTREGKLVEIDEELLVSYRIKISNKKLRTWANS